MNIAFQTVAILVLALPGIIFRQQCSIAGRFRRRDPWPEEVAGSIVATGIAHTVWVPVANFVGSFFSLRVDLKAVFILVSGIYGPEQGGGLTSINAVADHPLAVLCYFGSVYFASWIAGTAWRKYREACGGRCWAPGRLLATAKMNLSWESIVERWNADTDSCAIEQFANEPGARRYAQWRGILRVGSPTGREQLETLFAATIVIGPTPYLYLGLLANVEWNEETGDPELYELKHALRRKLVDDATNDQHPAPYDAADQRFYSIRGDSLILRHSDVSTLNVMYLFLDIEEETGQNNGQASPAN